VYVSGGTISIKNTANVLNDMDMFQGIGNEMCGDASFDKAGCEALDNVFRQVFPPARRSQFINRHRIFATIYADAVGKVKEIVFDFDVTSTVTPQELYQLDVSLKALPALNYIFKDCTGANYRVSGYTFYINQLD
jgi:hypothetical protein